MLRLHRLNTGFRWAGLVAAGLLLVGCLSEAEESADSAESGNGNGPRPTVVTYVEAEAVEVEDTDNALGTVEAKWSASIANEVAGTLDSIEVDAGDRVEPGQLLATLDSRDMEIEMSRASANVRRLEARVRNNENEVSRQRRLSEQGHVSEAALEAVEAELVSLQEELEAARSELRSAERNLERAEIRTPHGGTVGDRLVSEGDFVAAGTVILEIPRADRLQIRIPVPERRAEDLQLGLPVRLSTGTNPDRVVETEITRIQPRVSSSSRSITVIAEIDNPGGWRPGASVNAQIVMQTRENVVLPVESVVRRSGGNVVFIADGDQAREQPVALGKRTRAWIEVVDGVAPGDRIVVDGAGFLSDGAPIAADPHERATAGPEVAAEARPQP